MPAHAVVIHDLVQALTAGDLASETGVQIEIRSPAEGAANIGPAVFQAIAAEVEKTHPGVAKAMILDCGSDPGLAMGALRQGCRDICINVSDEVLTKLNEIAAVLNARIHGPPKFMLDLGEIQKSHDDDRNALITALRDYFGKDAENE